MEGVVYFWLVEGDPYCVGVLIVFDGVVVGDVGEVEFFYFVLCRRVEGFVYSFVCHIGEDRVRNVADCSSTRTCSRSCLVWLVACSVKVSGVDCELG